MTSPNVIDITQFGDSHYRYYDIAAEREFFGEPIKAMDLMEHAKLRENLGTPGIAQCYAKPSST